MASLRLCSKSIVQIVQLWSLITINTLGSAIKRNCAREMHQRSKILFHMDLWSRFTLSPIQQQKTYHPSILKTVQKFSSYGKDSLFCCIFKVCSKVQIIHRRFPFLWKTSLPGGSGWSRGHYQFSSRKLIIAQLDQNEHLIRIERTFLKNQKEFE